MKPLLLTLLLVSCSPKVKPVQRTDTYLNGLHEGPMTTEEASDLRQRLLNLQKKPTP